MDRRRFLLTTGAASTVGVGTLAQAATSSPAWGGPEVVPLAVTSATVPSASSALQAIPSRFSLAWFAPLENASTRAGSRAEPLHLQLCSWAAGHVGSLSSDSLLLDALYLTDAGLLRHGLWSQTSTGCAASVRFLAHPESFAGFELTHRPAQGEDTVRYAFSFVPSNTSQAGTSLRAGLYVLAGPRKATGLAPDLQRYAYSGDERMPVRAPLLHTGGLDFPYLTLRVSDTWR